MMRWMPERSVADWSLSMMAASVSRSIAAAAGEDGSVGMTLSKTKKKGREHKENVVSAIRDAAEKYASAYVFTFANMRNLKFKEFRERLNSSSSLGSNKVMQIALGRSVADKIKPGIHKVSKLMRGDSGLCFTSLPKEHIQRLFGEYEDYDFARTGSAATETGLWSLCQTVLCEEGKQLSPESARILRLLGVKMATFKLHLVCRCSLEDFEVYKEGLADTVAGERLIIICVVFF
ncbi:mRNA turnover protein 4 homolog [Striga asiatica]|uniref:mRNA turnover protein 4 homolog n=1 Tax=Striga asiatica TaxID=4170 RepID=A0A5A7P1P6_STRAF|nr:mRNA turnover protein 4 homolog [Striga asiatica]